MCYLQINFFFQEEHILSDWYVYRGDIQNKANLWKKPAKKWRWEFVGVYKILNRF